MSAGFPIDQNQVDLVELIDWNRVECLNQKPNHTIHNVLKQDHREDEGLNLESDADEQLLIYIPFTQVIKLHSFVIQADEEQGPRTVKHFANKEHMGFSNVSDFPPSDTTVLSPENLKGKPSTLKYVRFQCVRSLTIFIEDNQGGAETTKIQKIVFYGSIRDLHVRAPLSKDKLEEFLSKRNITSSEVQRRHG